MLNDDLEAFKTKEEIIENRLHVHLINYSDHLQAAFHMPGCGLRGKYFSYPHVSPDGTDLEELRN